MGLVILSLSLLVAVGVDVLLVQFQTLVDSKPLFTEVAFVDACSRLSFDTAFNNDALESNELCIAHVSSYILFVSCLQHIV